MSLYKITGVQELPINVQFRLNDLCTIKPPINALLKFGNLEDLGGGSYRVKRAFALPVGCEIAFSDEVPKIVKSNRLCFSILANKAINGKIVADRVLKNDGKVNATDKQK
jgi:hypothetical protein